MVMIRIIEGRLMSLSLNAEVLIRYKEATLALA